MLTTLGALRSTSFSPTARGRPSDQLRSGRWQREQEISPFTESRRSKNKRSPRSIAFLLPETRLLVGERRGERRRADEEEQKADALHSSRIVCATRSTESFARASNTSSHFPAMCSIRPSAR